MGKPAIHGNRTTVSASDMLNALGDSLSLIRQQDRLTWADVGAVLGKSDDQAAKYADGSATMDVVSFWRAREVWGSRFTGLFDRLGEAAVQTDDRHDQTVVLAAALVIARALEGDNSITPDEIRANRKELEAAHDALGAQLRKI